MADTPYQAPYQGYSWAGQPPTSSNPWITAGTSMIQDYAIMRQNQDVAQYHQQITPPPFMSLPMQHAVAFNPQYSFGMVGGQPDVYRQSMSQTGLTAGAFTTSAGAMALSTPFFTGAMRASSALMGGGLMASAAGMIAGGIITAPFMAVSDRGIARARWRADIAEDISQYAPRYTQGVGFGMSATNALSDQIMRSMQDNPGFFRAQDQMKIFKMGLSSGMVRGGNTEEFKKNFEDLKTNAKDIIQMLNTTVEGGMSVMKELQNAGFSSPAQIRAQVANAKAMGMVSGIGTQNMLSLAATGAQRAIGTGWAPTAAANMYQTMGAITAGMAQTNPAFADAVRGAGGVANAGANMASGIMNAIRSGMGIQTMAYLMDPTTKQVSNDRLLKLAAGKVDPLELINGANRYGMSGGRGGANNRVLIVRDMMRNVNKMSPEQLALTFSGIYRTWASEKGGADEASAYVFAKKFGRDETTTDLLSQMLSNPMRLEELQWGRDRTSFMNRVANQPAWMNPISRSMRNVINGAKNALNQAGDSMYSLFAGGANEIGVGILSGINSIMGGTGLFQTTRYAPSETVIGRAYGISRLSGQQSSALRSMTSGDIRSAIKAESLPGGMLGGKNIASVMKGWTNNQLQMFIDKSSILVHSQANQLDPSSSITGDPQIMSMLSSLGAGARTALKDRKTLAMALNTAIDQADDRNSRTRNLRQDYNEWRNAPAGAKEFEVLDRMYDKVRKLYSQKGDLNWAMKEAFGGSSEFVREQEMIRMAYQGTGDVAFGNKASTSGVLNSQAYLESKKYIEGGAGYVWQGSAYGVSIKKKRSDYFNKVAGDIQGDLAVRLAQASEMKDPAQRKAAIARLKADPKFFGANLENLTSGDARLLSIVESGKDIKVGEFGYSYMTSAKMYARGQREEAAGILGGSVMSASRDLGLKGADAKRFEGLAAEAFSKNAGEFKQGSFDFIGASPGTSYDALTKAKSWSDVRSFFESREKQFQQKSADNAANEKAIAALTEAIQENTKKLEDPKSNKKELAEERSKLLEQKKNLESSTPADKAMQNSSTLPAQTATPQILGYWNNQWNVMGR